MSGCRSCSQSCSDTNHQPTAKAEKLEKLAQSGNPRYPRIFEGEQAIFSDEKAQLIVTVMEDKCDEKTDSFKLKALEIVGGKRDSKDDTFTVSQIAGENCWKLQALI
jgi:hypothetical protein